jgi:hypothetical protein
VDASDAQFYLATDIEYSTEKRWKLQPGQLQQIGDQPLSSELLGQWLRRFYETRRPGPDSDIARKKLRFLEKNLMAGDPVCVIGPAYRDPDSGQIRIHRVHPNDRFFVGDGSPADLCARIRKNARWLYVVGMIMAIGGAGMAATCFLGA